MSRKRGRSALALDLTDDADIQALDPDFKWYNARVRRTRGNGDETEVLIHYLGYGKSLDEWIAIASGRLAAPGTHAPTPVRPSRPVPPRVQRCSAATSIASAINQGARAAAEPALVPRLLA